MAIYHLSSQIIGRSGGKSAVASSAYRAGEQIEDEHIGMTFDYTKKMGVDYKEILAPDRSPAWVQDRAQLWNQVELIERRKDAQLARELNIALPKELSKEQQIELIRNFTKEQFVDKGMVADLTMHHLDGENPHAHVMLTTRGIGPEGFGKKNREWNDKELLKDWRKEWAERTNQALEKAGVLDRIDHRSYKDQGSKQIPQIHVGVHANAMERKGIRTERGDINRGIKELNIERDKYNADRRSLIQKEKQYQAEVKTKEVQPSKAQTSSPISEPTPKIVQQPRTLEQVKQEVESARVEVNKTYEEMSQQSQIVSNLKQELKNAISSLNKCDQLDRDIAKVNKNIENINRFNLLKRNELKALEKERDSLVRQKQIAFGNTSWNGLADKVNRLSNAIEPEKKKLAMLENKHAQARKGFDQVNTKMRSLEQGKDHTMGNVLAAREKPSRNQGNKAIGQPLHDTIKALGNSIEKVNREEKFKAERMKQKLDREMQTPQKGRGKGRDQGWEMGDD